jgi:hypothetical protein
MLLVYFAPRDPASLAPGFLSTFELFLEDRESAYKVQLEAGPRLRSAVHRLQDMAVQHVGSKSVGAWLLHDDAAGRRALHCVPVAFSDGAVESGASSGCGCACVRGRPAAHPDAPAALIRPGGHTKHQPQPTR